MQNPYPSSPSNQLQMQQWSVPNQASHPNPSSSSSQLQEQWSVPNQANPSSSSSQLQVQQWSVPNQASHPYPSSSSSQLQEQWSVPNQANPSSSSSQLQVQQWSVPNQASHPYPSSSSSQLQEQWSVPNQASHPHTFFNNAGTMQEQPDQAAASDLRYYRPKAIPSQAVHMNRTEYQAAVQRQALHQQVTIPAAQINVHRPPAPQARKKTMPPQPSQSNARQTATIIQQRSVPQKSHTVAPRAAAGSIRSTEHGRKSMFVHSTMKFTG
jgi:hypothetical protein